MQQSGCTFEIILHEESYFVVSCDPTVVGVWRKHHIELGLVRSSFSLIHGIKDQGQRVFITEVSNGFVTDRKETQTRDFE